MKNKIFNAYSVLLISLVILLECCDPADNRLKIVNNSNSDIFFYYACDSTLSDFEIFRSGNYSNAEGQITYIIAHQTVQAKSFVNIPLKGINAWTKYIKCCPKNEMNFYFILDSIVAKHTDIEIRNSKLYQKHINITLDELKHHDWTVYFP
jgi:hypothetical protein